MKKEFLIHKLTGAITHAQKGRWERFFARPLFTVKTSLLLFLYRLLRPGRPMYVSWETFFGTNMILNVAAGGASFPWGFINHDPEIRLTKYVIKNLAGGSTFFDIGAHFGFYSLLAECIVGKNGKIHSFEPTPSTFRVLQKNVKNLNNVVCVQKAVLDTNKSIAFTDFGENFSAQNTFLDATTLDEVNKSSEKKRVVVDAIGIDAYCQEKQAHPNFIKIDTEGTEWSVVKGMANTLKVDTPILAIEFWGRTDWSAENDALIEYLGNCGYAPYVPDSEGDLQKYSGSKEFDYENLIFIKENE